MPTQIIMPSGGQTTNESLITKWHKKPGDLVQKGEVLFEIETDKTTLEVQSFKDGLLLAVNCPEGSYATNGSVVALIGQPGETADSFPVLKPRISTLTTDNQATDRRQLGHESDPNGQVLSTHAHKNAKVLLSPKARKAAIEHAIDMEDVQAQHPGQVLHYEQVLSFLSQQVQPMQTAEAEPSTSFTPDEIPVSPMRQTIAQKMLESVQAIPQYQIIIDLDMSELVVLRRRLNEQQLDTIKVSYNDLLIYITSRILQHFPLINASYLGDRIRFNHAIGFGLAVAVPGGLLVPVVHQSEQKNIYQIARENTENIQLANGGKLSSQVLSGGTITLSNLGKYNVHTFSAIINKPESSILAIGSIQDRPVAVDGTIQVKPMMTMTASFDHRLIDGAYGAEFLYALKKVIENPSLIVYYQQSTTGNQNKKGV